MTANLSVEKSADTAKRPALTLRTGREWSRLAVVGSSPIVFAWALLVLFLRRPETLTSAEFWADDGPVYSAALSGPHLFDHLGGFLIPLQRAVMWLAAQVPPPNAPLVANAVALFVLAATAAFIASERLAGVVPDRARRLGIAAALVLLPASFEVTGTLSHLQWVLAAFLISYAGASRGRTWELVVVAIAAVSGPQVVLIAPLYALRWWKDRSSWPAVAVVAAAATLEGGVYIMLNYPVAQPPPAQSVPVAQAIIEHLTTVPALPGALVLALLVASWRTRLAVPLGLLAAGFLVVGVLRAGELGPWYIATRYFWIPTWLIVSLAIVSRPSRVRTAALAFATVIAVIQFSLYVPPRTGWSTAASCIRVTPCVVPVEPVSDRSDYWAVRWP